MITCKAPLRTILQKNGLSETLKVLNGLTNNLGPSVVIKKYIYISDPRLTNWIHTSKQTVFFVHLSLSHFFKPKDLLRIFDLFVYTQL